MGKEQYFFRLKCNECGESIGWSTGSEEDIEVGICCDRCRWAKEI